MPVHYGHQIQKTPSHWDVGDVSALHLVDFMYLQIPEQIRIDLVCRISACGFGPRVERPYAHKSHQAPNSLSIDHETMLIPEVVTQTPRPFEGMPKVQDINLSHQLKIRSTDL